MAKNKTKKYELHDEHVRKLENQCKLLEQNLKVSESKCKSMLEELSAVEKAIITKFINDNQKATVYETVWTAEANRGKCTINYGSV